LGQREPTSPLTGLFRLLYDDETIRMEAAISIALHLVALQYAITSKNGGNLRAKLSLAPAQPEMPEQIGVMGVRGSAQINREAAN
jgi:hypothetical protein